VEDFHAGVTIAPRLVKRKLKKIISRQKTKTNNGIIWKIKKELERGKIKENQVIFRSEFFHSILLTVAK
jgi:hypothetical protein